MPQKCCAINCGHSYKICKLKRFPTDAVRKNKWVQAIRRDAWKPNIWDRVCMCHFAESAFERQREDKKLRADAVPTIFKFYDSNPTLILKTLPRHNSKRQQEDFSSQSDPKQIRLSNKAEWVVKLVKPNQPSMEGRQQEDFSSQSDPKQIRLSNEAECVIKPDQPSTEERQQEDFSSQLDAKQIRLSNEAEWVVKPDQPNTEKRQQENFSSQLDAKQIRLSNKGEWVVKLVKPDQPSTKERQQEDFSSQLDAKQIRLSNEAEWVVRLVKPDQPSTKEVISNDATYNTDFALPDAVHVGITEVQPDCIITQYDGNLLNENEQLPKNGQGKNINENQLLRNDILHLRQKMRKMQQKVWRLQKELSKWKKKCSDLEATFRPDQSIAREKTKIR